MAPIPLSREQEARNKRRVFCIGCLVTIFVLIVCGLLLNFAATMPRNVDEDSALIIMRNQILYESEYFDANGIASDKNHPDVLLLQLILATLRKMVSENRTCCVVDL